jgi:uncharacterized membrane protein
MNAPAFALVIAVERYGNAARLAPLDGAVRQAQTFVTWLTTVRQADPGNVYFCASEAAHATAETPDGVRHRGAQRDEIRRAANDIATAGQDRLGDLYVLCSTHGGRVDLDDEVILAEDFTAGDGDKAIRLVELRTWLRSAMGPGNHFWFIDACRTAVDFEVNALTLPRRTSRKGSATAHVLYTAVDGAPARARSGFPDALVDGLHGRGVAKAWLDNAYWVTFPRVVAAVRAAVEAEGIDIDSRPDEKPGRILHLSGVPDVPVTFDVEGAVPGDSFRLMFAGGERRPFKREATWPSNEVKIPPGPYFLQLELGYEELAMTSPNSSDTPLDIYAPVQLSFRKAPPPQTTATLIAPDPPMITAEWSHRGIRERLNSGSPPIEWTIGAAPLTLSLFDRDELVRRITVNGEAIGGGELRAEHYLHDVFDLRQLLPAPGPASLVADTDPGLRLSLLGAAAIGGTPPYAPAVADLVTFDSPGPHGAGIYVLTGGPPGTITVHSDPQQSTLERIPRLSEPACHAGVLLPAHELHTLHVHTPELDLALPATVLPHRITLIVLIPPSRSTTARCYQFALPIGAERPPDLFRLLTEVRFAALVQRRFAEHRPVLAEETHPEHRQLWSDLLRGDWLDPLTLLIAAYELVRRGSLDGEDRQQVIHLIDVLRQGNGDAFDTDLAVLEALAHGREPDAPGLPLVIDGIVALGGPPQEARPAGRALDYTGPWTRWRTWPTRHPVSAADSVAPTDDRANAAREERHRAGPPAPPREKRPPGTTTLVAIGYPDETTAAAASVEAHRLAKGRGIRLDAISSIVRDRDGKFHLTTHHAVADGATWGMFWGLLFGMLFFAPFIGLAIGAGMGALMGKITKTAVDNEFADQVRDMLAPGTSALFLLVERDIRDEAVEALSEFGGTVLMSSLSMEAEAELAEALQSGEARASAADQ